MNTEDLGEKPMPELLCPAQIPHGLTLAKTGKARMAILLYAEIMTRIHRNARISGRIRKPVET